MYDKLTQSDIDKMKAEIEYREVTLRAEILTDLKEAKAQGDLSENFEYHAAKRARNQNDGRIRYLKNMIKTATIVEDATNDMQVGMNNTVVVFSEKTQKEMTYRIVTTVRANPLKRLISIDSPVGKAIYKKKVGDRCFVETENGDGFYVVIRTVEKTTDDSEDQISQY